MPDLDSPNTFREDIDGISIRLLRSGSRKDDRDLPVIVLHGWGASIEAVLPIVSSLARDTEVLALDLPGFGQSEEPPSPWTSDLYAEYVAKVLEKLEIGR